jgi:hypothetical protein
MPASTRLPQRFVAGLAALLLLGSAGCGSRKMVYAEVEGKVTLNKKPLSGVKVTFYPDSEGREQLPFATAMTDETGKYTLASPGGKSGALAGKHRVVVNWPPEERLPDGSRPPPRSPAIPVNYTVADATPLVVEVKEGDRQTINLELSD